jgi:hypothetical protein
MVASVQELMLSSGLDTLSSSFFIRPVYLYPCIPFTRTLEAKGRVRVQRGVSRATKEKE